MAFKKRIESKPISSSLLPYLNVYIEKLNDKEKKKLNGTLHPVLSISFPKSGKGVMVYTELFSCFYWKGSDEWNTIESWLIDFDLDGCLFVSIDLSIPKTFSELGSDNDYSVEVFPSEDKSRYTLKLSPKSTGTEQENK